MSESSESYNNGYHDIALDIKADILNLEKCIAEIYETGLRAREHIEIVKLREVIGYLTEAKYILDKLHDAHTTGTRKFSEETKEFRRIHRRKPMKKKESWLDEQAERNKDWAKFERENKER